MTTFVWVSFWILHYKVMSSQLCVNSKHCRGSYLWLQIPSSHPYGPTLNQRFERMLSADLESLFWFFLSQGLTPILASFASQTLISAWGDYWFSTACSPTPCPAGSSLKLPDAGSVAPHSFLFSGMKAHMWPDVQCLETTLLCVIFSFIAEASLLPILPSGSEEAVSVLPHIVFPLKILYVLLLLSFNIEWCHTRVWGQLCFFSLIVTFLFS